MELFPTDRERLAFLLETDAALDLDFEALEAQAEAAAEEPSPEQRPKYITNYIGSKQKLVDWIWKHTPEGVESAADAFSGSAVVAYMYKTKGLKVLANDRLRYCHHAARASLEELLLDFEDYLRHRRLPQWAQDSPEALAVRGMPRRSRADRSDPTDLTDLKDLTDQERWALYAPWLESADPAVRANAIICLIHQANFLLDQQIAALEKSFVEEGGLQPRGWHSGRRKSLIRWIGLIQRIKYLTARNAESPWFCGPPRAEKTPEASSGAVRITRIAKGL